MMQTFVTSDLHLGCRQSRAGEFIDFLCGLPDGARLVLNGDIVSHYCDEDDLEGKQKEALAAIVRESYEREVIWVRGNNDRYLTLRDPGQISFVYDYAIDKQLYIAHGNRFDRLMPLARIFLIPVRLVYDGICRLFRKETHVAEFAKRFNVLYRVLCRHVARNAVRYARKHGYEAVTCGHTHYPEESIIDDVRYLNTGCWTENSCRVVIVDGSSVELGACHARGVVPG